VRIGSEINDIEILREGGREREREKGRKGVSE
jgi:hypothetical protein